MPTPNSSFASDALVYSLADAVAQNSDVKGKLWSKMLSAGSNTADDFSFLEGPPESKKPIWKKTELAADGGDKVVFSTIGDVGGPGVRGEAELTGHTSKPRMGAYTVQVDFWRDAVELTKKQLKFLATGKSVESIILSMLSRKLGRQKMYDMMMSLIRNATSGNTVRPNGRTSRDTIRATDTLSTTFLVESKARLQGLGAAPVNMSKSPSGSPVYHYLAFAGQDAMVDIRNSTSFQNALQSIAQASGSGSELFNGKLVDWQGVYLWEHTVVNPDVDDVLGSPIAPYGLLGTGFSTGTTAIDITFGSVSTSNLYSSFFPGYDWQFVEGQTAAPDTTVYYVWIVNPPNAGTDPGKAGFYSYTGSAGNNGNKLTMTGRLGATASGVRVTTLGNVVWDASTMSTTHAAGSYVIPANAYGVPIGHSFVFGAGAALRAYGSIDANPIGQDRDYKFVKGMGYESIYGQSPCYDTQGLPRNYVLLQHAIEHPGITVPYLAS